MDSEKQLNLATVLGFLQTSARTHERERALFDLERAELRNRISQLEGELVRKERERYDVERRCAMLEGALKAARGGMPAKADSDEKDASGEPATRVLRYSRGNVGKRTRDLLKGYLVEAAKLAGAEPAELLSEWKRRQSSSASGQPPLGRMSTIVGFAAQADAAEAAEDAAEIVEDVPRPEPRPASNDSHRDAVMKKFVEYESTKRRTGLSRVRELRRQGDAAPAVPAAQASPQDDSPTSPPSNSPSDPSQPRLSNILRSPLASIRSLSFHPSLPYLFCASLDHTLRLFPLPAPGGKKPQLDIEPLTLRHPSPVLSCSPCFDSDGAPWVFSGCQDGSVWRWGVPESPDPYQPYRPDKVVMTGHTDAVWDVRAHLYYPTSPLTVTCGADGTVRVWNGTSLAETMKDEGVALDWVNTSPTRVVVGGKGKVGVWDAFVGSKVGDVALRGGKSSFFVYPPLLM